MTRIEDELIAAARQRRDEVRATADVDAALADVTGRSRRRPRPVLRAAAVVLAVGALGAGIMAVALRGDDRIVADGPATSTDAAVDQRAHVLDRLRMMGAGDGLRPPYRSLGDLLPNVTWELEGREPSPLSDLAVVATVTSVDPGKGFLVPGGDAPGGIPTEFDDPDSVWRTIHVHLDVEQSLGGRDAPESMVVGLPFHEEVDALPAWEEGLAALGRAVFFLYEGSPVYDYDDSILATLDDGGLLAPVADDGTLSLPAIDDPVRAADLLEEYPTLAALASAGQRPRVVLTVDDAGLVTDGSGGATVTTLDGSDPRGEVQGSDLGLAEPGFEVTFDRIGSVRLGQAVDPAEVDFQFHPCGYWPAGLDAAEFDNPGQAPTGLVDGSGDQPTLSIVHLRKNPVYRTASGVGVGTRLDTLRRIYGDDLVVDRSDGWERPTDGLLASYQDVAAVRNGDRALTFYLRGDVVEAVKLSGADSWGDDEGCA